jgi:iron-sulfur cluster repair protein YtfE (RIC family)
MEQDMADTLQLDRTLTINEIVALHPETIAVFNRFGMDTCCGGGVTIDEAARRDTIDANAVIVALNEVLGAR